MFIFLFKGHGCLHLCGPTDNKSELAQLMVCRLFKCQGYTWRIFPVHCSQKNKLLLISPINETIFGCAMMLAYMAQILKLIQTILSSTYNVYSFWLMETCIIEDIYIQSNVINMHVTWWYPIPWHLFCRWFGVAVIEQEVLV